MTPADILLYGSVAVTLLGLGKALFSVASFFVTLNTSVKQLTREVTRLGVALTNTPTWSWTNSPRFANGWPGLRASMSIKRGWIERAGGRKFTLAALSVVAITVLALVGTDPLFASAIAVIAAGYGGANAYIEGRHAPRDNG